MPLPFPRNLALLLTAAAALLAGCAGVPGNTSDAGARASLDVANGAAVPIARFYASSCSDSGWGADRLGGTALRVGAQTAISLPAGCWDLKAEFVGGAERIRRGVQIRAGGSANWRVE